MLRTKITEIGKLTFLDDGGLVCFVTLDATSTGAVRPDLVCTAYRIAYKGAKYKIIIDTRDRAAF
jgi:hypothetical protein